MASSTRVRDWADVDYYAVLGVAPDADADEIARAYRALAKQLHPDSGVGDDERFKEVAAAYAVLGDPRIRVHYDRVRREALAPPLAATGIASGRAPGAPPAFRGPTRRSHGFTRGWAVASVVGGIVTTLLGLAVGVATWRLHVRDAQARGATIPVLATRTGGPDDLVTFTTREGAVVRVPEPDHVERAGAGDTVGLRYDPDDPTDVIADESTTGRDVTLAIVALKLLVGGPVLVVLGARRLAGRSRP